LVQRTFAKSHELDYWESGMDLGLSRDMFDSFIRYQRLVGEKFQYLQKIYGFTIVDGNRSVADVNQELRCHIESLLTA
jgi:dTMP kinase